MAIDYQVGDIVEPYFYYGPLAKLAEVLDITEKGGYFKILPNGPQFFVGNSELHLLKRSGTGTLLYGDKSK